MVEKLCSDGMVKRGQCRMSGEALVHWLCSVGHGEEDEEQDVEQRGVYTAMVDRPGQSPRLAECLSVKKNVIPRWRCWA